MKGIFIAGTDTGVGKTMVTGLLAKYLKEAGYDVTTQKWVQTGVKDFSRSDVAVHLQLMGGDKREGARYQEHRLSYLYQFGASPHLAACLEGRRTVPCKIKKSFNFLARKFDFVLVEGVGGVLVPYDKRNLVIDIAKELKLPVVVVAQNKLGAINHTLLTIEALKRRKFKILGIIFNCAQHENKLIAKDNPEIVKSLSGERILGVLPWEKDIRKINKSFIPIGEAIKKQMIKNG